MKMSKLVILLSVAATVCANAAVTVNIKNYNNFSAGIPVLGASDGLPVSSGCIATGFLLTGGGSYDFSTSTPTSIKADFTQFSVSNTLYDLGGGNFASGMFSGTQTANPALAPGDTTFTGKSIYTIFGNGTTLANSTALAVYKSGATFPVVNGSGNGATSTNNTYTAATVVFGTLVTLTPATEPGGPSGGITFAQGVQLIPEPSAALLGALGVLGLLRRRRI